MENVDLWLIAISARHNAFTPRKAFHILSAKPLTCALFFLTIFLLPFDAFRFFPGTYRPICLIPAVLLFFVRIPNIFSHRLDKASMLLIWFGVIGFLSTLIQDAFVIESFESFFDFSVTLFLLVFGFLGLNSVFAHLARQDSQKRFAAFFFFCVALAYALPTVIALVDALSVYGILPFGISSGIKGFFGGNQPNRVTGVSFEASWLVLHTMFAGTSFAYVYRQTKHLRWLVLLLVALLVFLLAFSLEGFAILGISAILFFLLSLRKINRRITIVGLVIIAMLIVAYLAIQNIETDVYFVTRLKNFTSIPALFRSDLSTFVRLGYPIISFLIFVEHPFFGVGGNNFGIYLEPYVRRYFPWAEFFYGSSSNEVAVTMAEKTGTPKCLFTRVLSDFGLFGAAFFYPFLFAAFKKERIDNLSFFAMLIVLCCCLQFDSLAFAILVVYSAFYNNLHRRRLS